MRYRKLGIISGLLTGLGGISYYLTSKAYKPKCKDSRASYEAEIKKGMICQEEFEQLPQEEVRITSDYACTVRGTYFPNDDSKDTVVILHGYSYTKYGSVRYMRMFYEAGYNVLIYDHRGHGLSGPSLCSMGHIEKYDLKTWLDWIEERNGTNGKIGTLGVSMGGATVLLHAAIDERVDFVIAECPYASVWEEFKYILKKEYGLPAFPILHIASILSKLKIGATFKDIAPEKGINKIDAPILFIHGVQDTYVLPEASEKMYEQRKGPKKLYLVEEAKHADAYEVNPQAYEATVKQFLEEWVE